MGVREGGRGHGKKRGIILNSLGEGGEGKVPEFALGSRKITKNPP